MVPDWKTAIRLLLLFARAVLPLLPPKSLSALNCNL